MYNRCAITHRTQRKTAKVSRQIAITAFLYRPLSWAMVVTVLATYSSVLAQTADTIYHGGPIVTVNDTQPTAEAIAVQNGKILAVGSKVDVLKRKGDHTRIVDLQGRTLVPGFVDGHAHFLGFGSQAVGANLLAPPDGTVNNIDDLVAKLQEFARGPDVHRTGWISGIGYDDAVLAEKRHPTRDDLDRVSTEVPVIAVHIHREIVFGDAISRFLPTVKPR